MTRANRLLSMFLFLTVVAMTAHEVTPQTVISKCVLATGGAVIADSSYRIAGTIGQPFVGVVGASDRISRVGFWSGAGGRLPTVVAPASPVVPCEFRLEQNYPNPFNPVTTIQFALPARSQVTLKLFDILGRQVAVLVDEELAAGVHKVLFNAAKQPSGVYIYRIESQATGSDGGRFVRAKKFVLLK